MSIERRSDWQAWVDKMLRSHDVLYERLDNRVHNAETVANEARAEFRAIRDEIKKDLRELRHAIEGDPTGYPGLRQDIAELKGKRAAKEMREGYHWSFWTALVPVLIAQSVILIGLLIVNWDRIRQYVVAYEHTHQSAFSDHAATKKPKAKRAHKPKPPPVAEEREPVEPETEN